MFEAFHESDYRRFWSAQFISNIGSWMQTVAQGWLVYRLTDSPFLLGFVGFANSIPSLLLMLPGGVVADQLDRKRVVAVSQVVQGLCAALLALSIHMRTIAVWQIVAAAITVGVAQSFSAPAYQAMVVDLLDDRTRLPNAVAMNSLQFNLSRVIGPLLAGIALSAWGSFWCFLLNALSFLPLVFVLFRIRNRQSVLENHQAMFDRLAEGMRFVRRERVILLLIAIVAAASLFGYPYLALMPVVARKMFADDRSGMGILMGAVGAGALVAALLLSIRTPPQRLMRRYILGSLIVFGVALASASMLPPRPILLALLVICGFTMVTCLALCNTSIQQRVPDIMRGRVLSMYTFAFYAFIPFGNLAAGMMAEQRGIRLTLLGLGGGLIVCGLLAAAGFAIVRRIGVPTASMSHERGAPPLRVLGEK